MKTFKVYLKEANKKGSNSTKDINELMFYFKQKVNKIDQKFTSTEQLYNCYRNIMIECIKNVYPKVHHVSDEENENLIKELFKATKNRDLINPSPEGHITKNRIYSPEWYSYSLDFNLKNGRSISIKFQTGTYSIDPKFHDEHVVFYVYENILLFLQTSLAFLLNIDVDEVYANSISTKEKSAFSNKLLIPEIFEIGVSFGSKIITIDEVTYFLYNLPSSVRELEFYSLGLQNEKLKTLPKNLPKIKENFYCHENKLITLEGSPFEVGGDFNCYKNQLKSLKGGPRKVGGEYSCFSNPLISLLGGPEEVGGNFNCVSTPLLKSLKGGPRKVGLNFNCIGTQITSLEGSPEYVGGNFNCNYNQLKFLKGAPKEVGGDFNCMHNSKKFTKEDVEAVCNVHGDIFV